jgi:peptidyl-prolyl cis-trans isomerase SurA
VNYCLPVWFWLSFALLLPAEIIDRIAVSAGNQAITTSDLDREIRVTTFLNRTQPDFSPAARRSTAERMVEQRLIQRELENSRYPAPAASEIDPILDKFKKDNFPTGEEYQRALADRGITEQDVKGELLWQRQLLLFIDVRFRPGVQVSDQDIADYFTKVVEPAARAAHPDEPVTLDDYRQQIEEKLAGERVDEQMNAWLNNGRNRAQVVFHPEAFQ